MQRSTDYTKPSGKARFTFYAINGGRRILIQGATIEDVLARLRTLCPGGNVRELWEGKA